jgi:hypothetical protein
LGHLGVEAGDAGASAVVVAGVEIQAVAEDGEVAGEGALWMSPEARPRRGVALDARIIRMMPTTISSGTENGPTRSLGTRIECASS